MFFLHHLMELEILAIVSPFSTVWGKVVFQTLTPNLGWSGLDDLGKPFQQGNYAFEIEFTTFDDVVHLRTGSVTLVR